MRSYRILITLILFCGLGFSVELFYRTWSYLRSCDTVCYNVAVLMKLDAFNRDAIYRFLAADPTLGYSPGDGTFVINEQGWNGAEITIDQGVRVNPNFVPASVDGAILAVGGGLVFGDKLSDEETWPAILERRLNRRVVNGGVSGYAPVQAVLRAENLLKTKAYYLAILSIVVSADLLQDGYVNFLHFYRPVVIHEDGGLRHTTVEESRRIASKNFACAHPWLPELFFWSHIAKRFFVKLGYDGRCTRIPHPRAATADETLDFVIERVAALPINKVILIQYPRYSFGGVSIDEARKIYDAGSRHGVRVLDVYDALRRKSLLEILKSENEIVADLIGREIAAMAQ